MNDCSRFKSGKHMAGGRGRTAALAGETNRFHMLNTYLPIVAYNPDRRKSRLHMKEFPRFIHSTSTFVSVCARTVS